MKSPVMVPAQPEKPSPAPKPSPTPTPPSPILTPEPRRKSLRVSPLIAPPPSLISAFLDRNAEKLTRRCSSCQQRSWLGAEGLPHAGEDLDLVAFEVHRS